MADRLLTATQAPAADDWMQLRPGTWVKGFPAGGRWPVSEAGREVLRRYVALALPIVRRALNGEAVTQRRAG